MFKVWGIKDNVKFYRRVHAFEINELKNLKGERWKQINGHKNYHVSNFGRVKSIRVMLEKTVIIILNQSKNSNGHLCVTISSDNKKRKKVSIHTLVAKHFLENKKNKKLIKHKDGVIENNRYNNLEWVDSPLQGLKGDRHPCSKKILQLDLKGKIIKEWASMKKIHKELGYCLDNIRMCCNGEQKLSHGFKWKYKEL